MWVREGGQEEGEGLEKESIVVHCAQSNREKRVTFEHGEWERIAFIVQKGTGLARSPEDEAETSLSQTNV